MLSDTLSDMMVAQYYSFCIMALIVSLFGAMATLAIEGLRHPEIAKARRPVPQH